MRVIPMCAVALMASAAACGLDDLWHHDLPSGVNALPSTLDRDGNGALDVIVPTLFDGSVWVLNERGDLLRQYTMDRWIRGSVAAAANPPTLAFEDASGRIAVRDLRGDSEVSILMEGQPLEQGGICLADLDGDGRLEIVSVRRNGIVGAFDLKLAPRWQYDAGAAVETPPAVGPVFNSTACVYICDTEGVLHAITGTGIPLWRLSTRETESPNFASNAPLVVQLAENNPSVVFTQTRSVMYAVDAVQGNEQWHLNIDAGNPGSPAVFTPAKDAPREMLIVTDRGAVVRIDGSGSILNRSELPRGCYVPRPLVADVDGDRQLELLVANMHEEIVVASLDGAVKDTIHLRGNAEGGIVLADVNQDGLLELLAATDRARLYCLPTQAKDGWAHPRANSALNACIPHIVSHNRPTPRQPSRRVRIESLAVSSFSDRTPFAMAFVRAHRHAAGRYVSVIIRCGGKVVGSTFRPFDSRGLPVRFVRAGPDEMILELNLHNNAGKIVASSETPLRPGAARLVELTPLDSFFETLGTLGNRYAMPKDWAPPKVLDLDSWHVARFLPALWQQPNLLAEAVPLVGMQKSGQSWAPFGPDHKDWPAISANTTPFFVETQPALTISRPAYEAIRTMAGERFLGYMVPDGDELVRNRWGGKCIENPESRSAFTEAVASDLELLSAECYGRLCLREERFLFPHQMLSSGASTVFAEIGRDTCGASLRFAFLRGAARQYGTRPWGVSVSATFCGSSPLDNIPSVDWSDARWLGAGPNCGHSTSLMFRLLMAAQFAGATFIERDPDPRLSGSEPTYDAPFHEDVERWRQYVRMHPQRGIPYTPFAFMMDFNHTWRPDAVEASSQMQSNGCASIDVVFRHAFAWHTEGDFEKGFLTNGPYGDVFDVITDTASIRVLSSYGLIWPVGIADISKDARENLTQYANAGGILVLNGAIAKAFSPRFVGVRFDKRSGIAAQIQTGLAVLPPITAPYEFQVMTPGRSTEVLAWTDAGAPLLTWHKAGNGLVLAAATESWLDERGQLLPLVPALMRAFADAFLPVQQFGDVRMFLNREPDGWIIALVNNNGVTKVPTLPASVDPEQTADCILQFKKGVPLRFLGYLGEFRWNTRANGLHTRVQPGDVAIVKATFGSE